MRSVADYLDKAAEFEALTVDASSEVLKKRYADITLVIGCWPRTENG